ncbi:PH domain-containing protein [Patescibacteria group bacterium]|nr:PH domain-containing protein [Patescibacteria group bacterium]
MSKQLELNENERLINYFRQHIFVLRYKLLISFILIVGPFFFLTLLLRFEFGLIIFFTLIFVGSAYLTKTMILWRLTAFYITSKKVIDVDYSKLLNKSISQVPLNQILDISFKKKGLWQNLINFGEVKIVIAQGTSKIVLENISKPQHLQQILQNTIDSVQIKHEDNNQLTQ